MTQDNLNPQNAGNPDPNAGGVGTMTPPAQVTDWKADLDPTIKDHPCLSNFKDIKDVVKSYVGVQPLIGREKIPLPPKDAKKEDWDNVFTRLGRPKDTEGYVLPKVELPEGFPQLQEDKLKLFKQKALELNLLPHQAAGLYEWYLNDTKGEYDNFIQGREKLRGEAETALRQEWGKGYDAKLVLAKKVAKTFGDEKFAELIEEGLGNDPTFLKFLVSVGSKMGEDGLFAGKAEVTLTPEEASAEIKKIQGDPKHPYFNKMHPEHQLAVQRMRDLFELAYPGQAPK